MTKFIRLCCEFHYVLGKVILEDQRFAQLLNSFTLSFCLNHYLRRQFSNYLDIDFHHFDTFNSLSTPQDPTSLVLATPS